MAALNMNTANVHKIAKLNEASNAITTTGLFGTVDATNGAVLTMDESFEKTLLVFQAATAEATVTIKAGNGVQGVNDLVFTVASGKTKIIEIESGRFKNVSGTDKGKVIITYTGASSVLSACAFVLL